MNKNNNWHLYSAISIKNAQLHLTEVHTLNLDGHGGGKQEL